MESDWCLMLEQVVSRESIWEVVKAKEAFEAYARGDYSVMPVVLRVANQVDAPLFRRVILQKIMGRATRGCGCAIAVLLAVAVVGGYAAWRYVLPWWRTQPPPASGGELTIRILDVGPINGDSI